MDCLNYFAHDYASARLKFLEAAESAGAEIVSFETGGESPGGDPLCTDVALLGNSSASRVLVVNIGTHGVEGFCGSGIAVGWLRLAHYRAIGGEVRVVLVHAINPHGFAWLRRVNEDNVDLNRNFISHPETGTDDPEYRALMPVILPECWDRDSARAFDAAWDRIVEAQGDFKAQAIISGGQYCAPDGVFYGGREPTWSNRTFRDIVGRFVQGESHVAFIDIHTGLGPFGAAELIHRAAKGSAEADRLTRWYGHGLASLADGTTISAARSDGLIDSALTEMLGKSELTAVTMEFGTYPIEDVLYAVRADNWLHQRGDLESALGRKIKADMRERFYPEDDDWKELVFLRGRQILARAVQGLRQA